MSLQDYAIAPLPQHQHYFAFGESKVHIRDSHWWVEDTLHRMVDQICFENADLFDKYFDSQKRDGKRVLTWQKLAWCNMNGFYNYNEIRQEAWRRIKERWPDARTPTDADWQEFKARYNHIYGTIGDA